jgi:hypothetical protein
MVSVFVSTTTKALPRSFIISSEKEDSDVPAVAFLTSSLALKYRLSKQEAKESKVELKQRI